MKPLTQSERASLREALAAKTFDQALHLTPGAILERLSDDPESTDVRDFFDADMFPNGIPKPLRPEQRARLSD